MMVSLPCCLDCASAVGRLHDADCPQRSAWTLRVTVGDCASAGPPLPERVAPFIAALLAAPAGEVDARLRALPSPNFALAARLLLGSGRS